MEVVPMTLRGVNKIRQELDNLKSVARPRVVKAISDARAHGDLKENAEYHAAKEEQGFIEARIKDIESKLSRVQVIDVRKLNANGKIVFGSTVEVLNFIDNEKTTYKIVGEDEADIPNNKISYISPIARALIGKEEGDEITVKAPKGDIPYEIIKVDYIL